MHKLFDASHFVHHPVVKDGLSAESSTNCLLCAHGGKAPPRGLGI